MAPPPELTDERLIAQVAQGCRESYRRIYEKYRNAIFNFVFQILRNRQIAEDCTQEVFFRLYHQAAKYKPVFKFSAWLYGIARNLALDFIRKKKVRSAVSLEAEGGPEGTGGSLRELIGTDEFSPEKIAASKEAVELLWSGIRRLELSDREVILLCDIQELPHREAAQVLGIKPAAVTVRLYRARRRLAGLLGLKADLLE